MHTIGIWMPGSTFLKGNQIFSFLVVFIVKVGQPGSAYRTLRCQKQTRSYQF
jgi:hypothetical protein